ncbi:MAG TPA: NAD(P)H-binding protein [Solirubrobacteraceae bacterium]
MNVAVIGGTGTFGRHAVAELTRRGHTVRVLSRTAQPDTAVEHRAVDLLTGAGLSAGLEGAEVVVDAANAQGRSMRELLVGGTRRLAEAGARAGVGHHVLISIIGIEAVPTGYYGAKLEQEAALAAVAGDALAHTVLRATQFHQLLDWAFSTTARSGMLPGGRIVLQPVDPADVAVRLAELIERGPGEGRVELAGPEVVTLGQLAREWRAARGVRRLIIPVPPAARMIRALQAGALTSTTAPRGQRTFSDWLRTEYPRA